APEDVHCARVGLHEVRRAVRRDRRALDPRDVVRLRLEGARPRLAVVGRLQAPDAGGVREIELDRAARLLDELRLAGDRVARHDRLRRAVVARDHDLVGVRQLVRDEHRSGGGLQHRRLDDVLNRARERGPGGGRRHEDERCGGDGERAHAPTMPAVRSTRKIERSRVVHDASGSIRRMRRALPLVALVALLAGCGGGHRRTATTTLVVPPPHRQQRPVEPKPIRRLVATSAGTLANPIQDAAAAPFGGGAVLVGGLTPADVSSNEIVTATRAGSRSVGSIPTALHDSAAVTIGRATYLFGGGTGTAQIDTILMIDPRTGAAQAVGHLPVGSSDQSAAVIGRTAYIVGGYTGTRWLDTIVAWRPGRTARVVAHLPHPLRYAAVTAADGKLVIAGGSLEDGSASRSVHVYTPTVGVGTHVPLLPAPTTHAAAAAIGDTVFVIGGRGAVLDTPTARIVAIDLRTGRVRRAGALPEPLSDLAAVGGGRSILVAGGHGRAGTVSTLTELVPGEPRKVQSEGGAVNVYAADRPSDLSPAVRGAKPYVYVPNSDSNTVDVIDQRTFRVVRRFAVGALPQHVVPAWNLRTLYVTNDLGNSLTPIDPKTGKPGRPIPVADPYNMYFTPDGRYAIVVAERLHRLDFRNAHTFRLVHSLQVP